MKRTTFLFASISLFVYFIFTSFSAMKTEKVVAKVLNENYAFIPVGTLIEGNDTLTLQSFIIFKTEVSNINYQEFLSDLRLKGETEKFAIAKIDSTLWSDKNALNMKYQDYYHSHPAYRDYPVVNVSKEGAELYCEWLSNKINATLGASNNIIFRLPTHAEWMRAAHGNLTGNNYPWEGPYLRNNQGSILCNHLRLDATSITRDSAGRFQVFPFASLGIDTENGDITAPVKSYWPNGYGIYNMSGNVAEMVADKEIVVGGSWYDPGYDVRIQSQKPYSGASRNVGFRMVATVVPAESTWLKIPKK